MQKLERCKDITLTVSRVSSYFNTFEIDFAIKNSLIQQMYMDFINSLKKSLLLPLRFTGIETSKLPRFHGKFFMTTTLSSVSKVSP